MILNFLKKIAQTGFAWIWLIFSLISIDQMSKFLVSSNMSLGQVINITKHFNIKYVLNSGAAFSFLADGYYWQYWFLVMVSILIIILLLFKLARSSFDEFSSNVALSFIISGAFGNLYDRITEGAVVDFLDFHVYKYHWPTFNFADVFIFLGAFLILTMGKNFSLYGDNR